MVNEAYQSRMHARGFMQIYGVVNNREEISSPFTNAATICIVLMLPII